LKMREILPLGSGASWLIYFLVAQLLILMFSLRRRLFAIQ
jgi:hypothetical protein